MRTLPAVLLGLLVPAVAHAQVGPGLGNLSYTEAELFEPVGYIESPQGHGNVAMVQGYMMVIYSTDGGGNATNGGIEFWNVSDPRNPTLFVRHDNVDTHGLREAHGFSLARYGNQLLLAAQGVVGIQIWDVTNPSSIQMISYLDLPGIDRGDYSGDWWLFWQAPYVYVAGVDQGLYVVDATNPAAPTLVANVPTGDLGGVSPAQVFVVGNLAVIGEAQGSALATLDVSQPDAPRLLTQLNGRAGYAHLFAADGKILTSGNVPPRATFLQVTPDGGISLIGSAGFFFDSGGYGSYQDGFFHSGFSNSYAKFDIANASVVDTGSSGRGDRDEDFATVLGNIVFAGDDHGVGTALIPHQRTPDTTPPTVEWMHPPSGSTGVALTTRIGLSFSDHIDPSSISEATIRLEDDTQTIVPATVSAQMGLVNVSPAADLDLLRTYTVVAEGLLDVAGNPSPRFEGTITTGDGSVPLSPTAAVANVDVNIAFGSYAIGVFRAGKRVYSDRDYTFTAQFPPRFDGQVYLQTANVDKNNFLTNFLTFDLLAPAEVSILYDVRASSVPNWMSGYTPTGETVVTTDTSFDVYSRRFQPGQVQLGGNGALGSSGADSMYSVAIVPDPVPCAIDLSPVETGTVTLAAQGPANGTYEWRVGGRTLTGATPSVFLPPGRHPVLLTVNDGVLGNSCGGVKIAHRPLAPTPGRSSTKLTWLGGDTINVNPDNGTVTRANATGIVWTADVGGRPESLVVVDDRIMVVNRDTYRVHQLNPADGSSMSDVVLPYASAPMGMVATPDDRMFVALSATGEVVEITTRMIVGDEFVAPTVRGIAWFDGRLYVTRFISPDERGEVYVVNPDTLRTIEVVELPFDPGPDTEAAGRGVPNYVADVQISPDGVYGFVASKKDNTARGVYRDGRELTFESRVRSIVSLFEVATSSAPVHLRFDINDREMVQSTLVSPYGDLLFVASQGVNIVDVFDLARRERVSQFDVGLAPQAMALHEDGRLAVYNFMSRSVRYYDASGLLGGTTNAVAELGEVVTVANEKLPANVLAGKRVFYDASDERMSRDHYISCASCHLEGDHDGRTWDFTQAGEGLRNTIALTGRGGTAHGNVHWTANFDEIQDFENDIRNAFGGTGFLTDEQFAMTSDPLGVPKAGMSTELDALAAYVASLDTFPPSPYRGSSGRMTDAARRGRVVFVDAECAECHGGERFTDGTRHDVMTQQASSGLGIGQPLDGTGFETPTLRDLWSGAPYLHDGSAPDLVAALDRHGDIPSITGADLDDLVAYLLELDGTSLPPEAPCDQGPNECVGGDEPTDGGVPPVRDGGATVGGDRDGGVSTADDPKMAPPSEDGCSCAATPHRSGRGLGLLLVFLLVGPVRYTMRAVWRRPA